MQGFWWKLPLLRSLSPLQRGLVEASGATLLFALIFLPAVHVYVIRPPEGVLTATAQVGATLLVAYGIEISWFLKQSRKRGTKRETWVGAVAGVSCFGLLGIGLALALSGASGTFSLAQEFVLSLSAVSILLLGLVVALGPLVIYEWTHAVHSEYPDE